MKSMAGTLAAPFPWFGGKSGACDEVWQAFGEVDNYVEPFAGSAAMLLGAPNGKRVETINDADGFVANFWRAVSADPQAVADAADWPCNEVDLFARHSWLVRHAAGLTERLHGDPGYFDAKIAGWWCWGACNWIGTGWCSGTGPWIHDGQTLIDSRQLPHLGNAGQGINRQLPALTGGKGFRGRGLQRATDLPRSQFIHDWMALLHQRLRDVRVTCGDWGRVVKDSVTTRHGLTAVFLDPPYTKGAMDYSAGGVGGELAADVRAWCLNHGHDEALRIVLCGHSGEHDELLEAGWHTRTWTARKGYALTDEAVENSASETLWCSPHCMPVAKTLDLFAEAA